MARAWIGQAMIAEKMGSEEALDLFRHAVELHNHPSACLGFAFHVVASTSHENDIEADSAYVEREARLQQKRSGGGGGKEDAVIMVQQPGGEDGQGGTEEGAAAEGGSGGAAGEPTAGGAASGADVNNDGSARGIPAGYESQYIAQAAVALARFTQGNSGAEDACAWNLLGLLQEKQGLNHAAAASFEACGDLLSAGNAATATAASVGSMDATAKTCSLNLARSKLNCGDSAVAMKLYQTVGVEHFAQVCSLGRAAYKSGELHLAYQYYERALSLAQASGHKTRAADVYVALATIAFANNDTDLSKQLLFLAVADPCLCPRALFVMCALGLLKDDAVLATSALAEFPKLQSIGLASADAFLRDQNVLTSSLLQLQGHIKFARNALLKAVRMYPNSSLAWREMASFLNRFTSTMTLDGVAAFPLPPPAAAAVDKSGSSGDGGGGSGAGRDTAPPAADLSNGDRRKAVHVPVSPAAHCATAAWTVKGKDSSCGVGGGVGGGRGGGGSGSALGLAAVGHLVAGTEAAVHEACRAAIKAAHETPGSPDAWSAVAAAAFVRGARFNEIKWVETAIAASKRCILQAAAEEAASPPTIHNTSRVATLQLLEHWARATLCECYLVLAYCGSSSTAAAVEEGGGGGEAEAEGSVAATIATMLSCCTEAVGKYTSQGASPDKLATFYLLVARGKLRLGAAKEAFLTAVQGLKLVPTSADAWQVVAQILEHKGLAAEAEACFRQSLNATVVGSMERVAVLLRLSLCALRAGNSALGKEAAAEAVRAGPTLPAVRLVLGLAKQAAGDAKGAKKEFGKAGPELKAYADCIA